MATNTSYKEQCKNKEADWKGMIKKRFRFKTFRFEYGRYCYVVHPVEGIDFSWWEWENKT